jgi:hypothetical protein
MDFCVELIRLSMQASETKALGISIGIVHPIIGPPSFLRDCSNVNEGEQLF